MKYTGFHRALELDRREHHHVWQIHLVAEIEMDAIDHLRRRYRERGLKPPTYTACLIKSIALAIDELRPQYPQLNSFMQKFLGFRRICLFDSISASCSTALEDESAVVVGVVEEPHKKTLTQISDELTGFSNPSAPHVKSTLQYYGWPGWLQRLANVVARNSTQVRYKHRGTFGLNPVGKFGADMHLTLPQTATLQFGMGSVRDRVVARDGQPVVVKTMYLTICFDRLLMNGRPASILLDRIRHKMMHLQD